MTVPLPPSGQKFAHPLGSVVWATIAALDDALKFELYEKLGAHLGDRLLADSKSSRTLRAIEALRRAASLLGHSPSVGDYRRLRAENRDQRFPADSSIRNAVAGGSWNDCLRAAGLLATADGESAVVISSAGAPRFTAAECIAALRECAAECGSTPTLTKYGIWARRPDVQQRSGRRPRSTVTMHRRFGSYTKALRAAGLARGTDDSARTIDDVVRNVTNAYSESQLLDGLKEVRQRLGRVPRSTQYMSERELIIAESYGTGAPRTIPSYGALHRQYGSWNEVLVAADMPPFGVRHTLSELPPSHRDPSLRDYSDEEILASIRECIEALGKGVETTYGDYGSWRKAEIEKSGSERGVPRAIPAGNIFYKRLDGWANAKRLAMKS